MTRRPQFAWHGAAVRSWRDLLHAGAVRAAHARRLAPPVERRHAAGAPARRTTARWKAPPALDAADRSHRRQGGERIVLPGRSHSHALKHVLQDLGVPPWLRERLPLLSDADGELLAVADLAYSAPFDAWLRQRGARLAWDDA